MKYTYPNKFPSIGLWKWIIYKITYTYSGILFTDTKKGNPSIYDTINGLLEHFAMWNKPDRKRQITVLSGRYCGFSSKLS